MIKTLPTLFKKTNTSALQYWKIWVEHKLSDSIIRTEYGQVGTISPQQTSDLISTGKNIGKSNETTRNQQAELEALYKWEKKKKRGYVEEIKDAQSGKVDNLITGGIDPMLAHSYDKQGHKIKFPCFCQPKLDGHRCIAIIKNGKCSLWSRTRKPITSSPHIIKELEANFKDCILDGELYSHKFKDNFEYISHLVRQEIPDEKHTDIEYHIYDIVDTLPFEIRYYSILYSDPILKRSSIFKFCKLVDTRSITHSEQIKYFFDLYKDAGYEGLILRNSDGGYENKRSYNLQKVKEFEDSEFKVIAVIEGKGKLRGHAGSFTCEDPMSGETFDVKMSGDINKLQEYFKNPRLWKNKMLTVQFQGRTGAKGVPRFPVGLRFREDI